MRALAALVLLGGCGAHLGDGSGEITADSPTAIDAPITGDDADVPLGPWGPPQKLSIASDPVANEDDGSLTYDGLEIVYAVVNVNDANRKDLMYASRPNLQSNFGPPVLAPFSIIANSSEETPRFSADNLTLFFAKTNGANGLDIFKVTRPTAGSTNWSGATQVAGVNSAGTDKWFMPCSNNRYLEIVGGDIAEGTLGGGAPVVSAELSSAQGETGPFMTQDCLSVYFASNRPDGTKTQLYSSSRAAVTDPWGVPALVVDFAALGGQQQDPFISTDNRTFVFVSDIGGTNDIYISTR